MTKTETLDAQEIEKMPAGEGMDALVARNVMCWHVEERRFFDVMYRVQETRGDCWVDSQGETRAVVRSWRPSTDIAQAMVAIDEIRAFHHFILTGHWCGPYTAELHRPSEEFRAMAEEAPLAMMRAALLASRHGFGTELEPQD